MHRSAFLSSLLVETRAHGPRVRLNPLIPIPTRGKRPQWRVMNRWDVVARRDILRPDVQNGSGRCPSPVPDAAGDRPA